MGRLAALDYITNRVVLFPNFRFCQKNYRFKNLNIPNKSLTASSKKMLNKGYPWFLNLKDITTALIQPTEWPYRLFKRSLFQFSESKFLEVN